MSEATAIPTEPQPPEMKCSEILFFAKQAMLSGGSIKLLPSVFVSLVEQEIWPKTEAKKS